MAKELSVGKCAKCGEQKGILAKGKCSRCYWQDHNAARGRAGKTVRTKRSQKTSIGGGASNGDVVGEVLDLVHQLVQEHKRVKVLVHQLSKRCKALRVNIIDKAHKQWEKRFKTVKKEIHAVLKEPIQVVDTGPDGKEGPEELRLGRE